MSVTLRNIVDDIYRSESRHVLATLIRLLGDFDLAEEALHEAFRAALEQNNFSHAFGKLALVQLPTGAAQLLRAMFGNLKLRNRYVEHLPALIQLRIRRIQSGAALLAMLRQWILNHHVHLIRTFECLADAPRLSTALRAR